MLGRRPWVSSVSQAQRSAGSDVPLFRLYLLRALYLLIAVGQGVLQWPGLIQNGRSLGFWEGTTDSMLAALATLCLLGLRYPLQMLPLLIFELTWKAIWTLAIGLPLWSGHHADALTASNFPIIGGGVVLCLIIIPWRYVWENYVRRPGDRWR